MEFFPLKLNWNSISSSSFCLISDNLIWILPDKLRCRDFLWISTEIQSHTASQGVVCGHYFAGNADSVPTAIFWMWEWRSYQQFLNQNQQFHKIPWRFLCTLKLEKSWQCLSLPFSYVHCQGQLRTLLQTANQSPLRWLSPPLWPASAEMKADLHRRSSLTFLLSHGFPLFRWQGL